MVFMKFWKMYIEILEIMNIICDYYLDEYIGVDPDNQSL